jgi:hypothetical protein
LEKEKESADDVIGRAEEALGFAILRISVWARNAKAYAMSSKMLAKSGG